MEENVKRLGVATVAGAKSSETSSSNTESDMEESMSGTRGFDVGVGM